MGEGGGRYESEFITEFSNVLVYHKIKVNKIVESTDME